VITNNGDPISYDSSGKAENWQLVLTHSYLPGLLRKEIRTTRKISEEKESWTVS